MKGMVIEANDELSTPKYLAFSVGSMKRFQCFGACSQNHDENSSVVSPGVIIALCSIAGVTVIISSLAVVYCKRRKMACWRRRESSTPEDSRPAENQFYKLTCPRLVGEKKTETATKDMTMWEKVTEDNQDELTLDNQDDIDPYNHIEMIPYNQDDIDPR
ncbi:hypothetical protein Btru_031270 [Bulinus truncatus]|nr:hypothetical protein Btru_031270 [Bulinus truncatus]